MFDAPPSNEIRKQRERNRSEYQLSSLHHVELLFFVFTFPPYQALSGSSLRSTHSLSPAQHAQAFPREVLADSSFRSPHGPSPAKHSRPPLFRASARTSCLHLVQDKELSVTKSPSWHRAGAFRDNSLMRLLLASKSPARLSTLLAAGITPIVRVSEVDEDAVLESVKAHSPSPSADEQVVALARAKRDAVASTLTSDALLDEEGADSLLLVGCDSMLEINGRMVGKPHLPEIARERIREMRGNAATLWTGHALSLLRRQEDGSYALESALSRSASTVVHFGQISDEEIEAYIASGEPLRVAGSFTIDGLGGPFITGVEGDHHSVVGISLPLLRELASELGVFWPDLWDFRRRTPSQELSPSTGAEG